MCGNSLSPAADTVKKGDIVPMPSGRPGRYEGGILGQGAQFTYLDEHGQPVWDSRNQCWDTVVISSMRVLIKLQPEYTALCSPTCFQ